VGLTGGRVVVEGDLVAPELFSVGLEDGTFRGPLIVGNSVVEVGQMDLTSIVGNELVGLVVVASIGCSVGSDVIADIVGCSSNAVGDPEGVDTVEEDGDSVGRDSEVFIVGALDITSLVAILLGLSDKTFGKILLKVIVGFIVGSFGGPVGISDLNVGNKNGALVNGASVGSLEVNSLTGCTDSVCTLGMWLLEMGKMVGFVSSGRSLLARFGVVGDLVANGIITDGISVPRLVSVGLDVSGGCKLFGDDVGFKRADVGVCVTRLNDGCIFVGK
jgi:hypothetical protein